MLNAMKYILLSILVLLSLPLQAQLYKWVDEDGVTHYTDRRPEPGGQQQQLSPSLERISQKKTPPEQAAEDAYPVFVISKPRNDDIVRSPGNSIDITVSIDPPLSENDFFQLYIDGLAAGETMKSTELTLGNVSKGTHRIQAAIVTSEGVELKRTPEVTFEFKNPVDLQTIAPNLVNP